MNRLKTTGSPAVSAQQTQQHARLLGQLLHRRAEQSQLRRLCLTGGTFIAYL